MSHCPNRRNQLPPGIRFGVQVREGPLLVVRWPRGRPSPVSSGPAPGASPGVEVHEGGATPVPPRAEEKCPHE